VCVYVSVREGVRECVYMCECECEGEGRSERVCVYV